MSRDSTGDGIVLAIGVLLACDAVVIGLVCGVKISPLAGLAIGAGALLAPVVLGAGVIALINQTSGWSALAAAYPARPIEADAARGLAPAVAIRWRWMGYSNCVRWAADRSHLHLKMLPIIGGLSPAISIPWADLDFDENASAETVACETTRGIRMWVPRAAVELDATRRRTLTPSAA